MRLTTLALFAALSLGIIADNCSGVTVLEAQTLPTVVHATWTPSVVDSTHPAPSVYTISLDGATPVNFDPSVICTANLCSAAVNVNSYGAHSVVVGAGNLAITTDPNSLQVTLAAAVNWVLNPSSNSVTGSKVIK